MKILSIVAAALFLSACNFLEVRVDVAQRSVLDNGNQKDKVIEEDSSNKEVDKTKTVIKTIP